MLYGSIISSTNSHSNSQAKLISIHKSVLYLQFGVDVTSRYVLYVNMYESSNISQGHRVHYVEIFLMRKVSLYIYIHVHACKHTHTHTTTATTEYRNVTQGDSGVFSCEGSAISWCSTSQTPTQTITTSSNNQGIRNSWLVYTNIRSSLTLQCDSNSSCIKKISVKVIG